MTYPPYDSYRRAETIAGFTMAAPTRAIRGAVLHQLDVQGRWKDSTWSGTSEPLIPASS